MASAQPAPAVATRTPATAGPRISPPAIAVARSPLACCRRSGATTSGSRPVRGGVEEPGRRARDAGQQRERPDVGGAGDQQRRDRALAGQPREVGGDHHRPPRDPVRDDAADQQAARPAAASAPRTPARPPPPPPPSPITANASATLTIPSPSSDAAWPANSFRYSGSRSTTKLSRIPPTRRRLVGGASVRPSCEHTFVQTAPRSAPPRSSSSSAGSTTARSRAGSASAHDGPRLAAGRATCACTTHRARAAAALTADRARRG